MHQDNYKIQDEMSESIPSIEKSKADTMYFHQVMKHPD